MSDSTLERGRKIAGDIGLKIYRCPQYGFDEKQVLELLGEACEVRGYAGPGGEVCANWEIPDSDTDTKRSLKGLIIAIRPIAQESEERKMLRRLVNAFKINPTQYKMQDIAIEAAEELLAKEQK